MSDSRRKSADFKSFLTGFFSRIYRWSWRATNNDAKAPDADCQKEESFCCYIKRLMGNFPAKIVTDRHGLIYYAQYQNCFAVHPETGEMLQTFSGHKALVWDLVVHKDYLYTTAQDHTVRCWRIVTGNQIWQGEHDHFNVTCVAVIKQVVVSGSDDKYLSAWDLYSGKKKWSREHGHGVTSLAVQGAGAILVSGSNDQTVRAWNDQGDSLWTVKCNAEVTQLLSTPQSWILCLSANRVLQALNSADGQVTWRKELASQGTAVSVCNDKVVVGQEGALLTVVETRTGGTIWEVKSEDRVLTVHMDHSYVLYATILPADENTIGVADPGGGMKEGKRGKVVALSADDGKERWTHIYNQEVACLRVVEGLAVASMRSGRQLSARDVSTGDEKFTHHHPEYFWSLCASEDAVLGGSMDGTLTCWCARQLTQRWQVKDDSSVQSIVCSEQLAVSGSKNGTLRAWNLQDGNQEWRVEHGAWVKFLVRVGDLLVSASDEEPLPDVVKAWNIQDGRLRWEVKVNSAIKCLTCSDTHVAVGTEEDTIYVIDLQTGIKRAEQGQAVSKCLIMQEREGILEIFQGDFEAVRKWEMKRGGELKAAWQVPTGSVRDLKLDEKNHLFVLTEDRQFHQFEGQSGRWLWSSQQVDFLPEFFILHQQHAIFCGPRIEGNRRIIFVPLYKNMAWFDLNPTLHTNNINLLAANRHYLFSSSTQVMHHRMSYGTSFRGLSVSDTLSADPEVSSQESLLTRMIKRLLTVLTVYGIYLTFRWESVTKLVTFLQHLAMPFDLVPPPIPWIPFQNELLKLLAFFTFLTAQWRYEYSMAALAVLVFAMLLVLCVHRKLHWRVFTHPERSNLQLRYKLLNFLMGVLVGPAMLPIIFVLLNAFNCVNGYLEYNNERAMECGKTLHIGMMVLAVLCFVIYLPIVVRMLRVSADLRALTITSSKRAGCLYRLAIVQVMWPPLWTRDELDGGGLDRLHPLSSSDPTQTTAKVSLFVIINLALTITFVRTDLGTSISIVYGFLIGLAMCLTSLYNPPHDVRLDALSNSFDNTLLWIELLMLFIALLVHFMRENEVVQVLPFIVIPVFCVTLLVSVVWHMKIKPRFKGEMPSQLANAAADSSSSSSPQVGEALPVRVVGDFLSKLGGADWAPDAPQGLMRRDDAGLYKLAVTLPTGLYNYKVTLGGTWEENYGKNGVAGGENMPVKVETNEGKEAEVMFVYDHQTHRCKVRVMSDVVRVVGTVIGAVGGKDWDPADDVGRMAFDGTLYTLLLRVPAGLWEWKIALNGTWEVNFGKNGMSGGENIKLKVEAKEASVLFEYHPDTKSVKAKIVKRPGEADGDIRVVGDFLSKLGGNDWAPDAPQGLMSFQDRFYKLSVSLPAGTYNYKVTVAGSWEENYGKNGTPGGENMPFKVETKDGKEAEVMFVYDNATHRCKVRVLTDVVRVVGTVIGAVGGKDWDPADDVGRMAFNGTLFTLLLHVPPGLWEWKIALNGTWEVNFGKNGMAGGENIKLKVEAKEASVLFEYHPDTNATKAKLLAPGGGNAVANSGAAEVRVVGDFLSKLGGTDWAPNAPEGLLTLSDGAYRLRVSLPAGMYNYKITLGGSWEENYGKKGAKGGENIPLKVDTKDAKEAEVVFVYSATTHVCKATVLADVVRVVGTVIGAVGGKDWDPADDVGRMAFNGTLFTLLLHVPAGLWEWKIALNGTWEVNFGKNGMAGGENIKLKVEAKEASVLFEYNPSTHAVKAKVVAAAEHEQPADVTSVRVVGDFLSLLGGVNWTPDAAQGLMTQQKDGLYHLSVALPSGAYNYKVTIGGGWDENYGKNGTRGGDNIELKLEEKALVLFLYNPDSHVVEAKVTSAADAPAGTISPLEEEFTLLHVSDLAGPLSPSTSSPDGGIASPSQADSPDFASQADSPNLAS
eukprot:g55303.t1